MLFAHPNYFYAPEHEVIQLDTFSKLWTIAKSRILSHQCKDKLLLYLYVKNYEINYFSQLQSTPTSILSPGFPLSAGF